MPGKIVNNLGSLPAVFVAGQGSVLTDNQGKQYIDFIGGIGVNCLGHNHPALVSAICSQVSKAIHISNYYNSDMGLRFADELLRLTGMDRVFFGNSGAEANEAVIKAARKYGSLRDEKEEKPAGTRKVIVTLEKSFHGRTLAALAATGQEKFHTPSFAPYPAGFRHIKANEYAGLDTAFDDTVCAFLIECVQGEGGVNIIDAEWARAACDAARKAGALIIADEVQTGMGRTGTLLACEQLGIAPDAVTLAKGIAGGIPMGAALFRGGADVFAAGDHQSTFGGNPLACAAGLAVLGELEKPDFFSSVTEKGEYIRNTVASWEHPYITCVRGRGLMIGIDIKGSPSDIQKKCLDAGLCVSTAGSSTVRFLPPLVITKEEINCGLSVFKSVLDAC